ncbi:CHAT domain-containing protein [Mycena vulgaris]|nr:CHAT domain-containing protein [Mycena vulgaris]
MSEQTVSMADAIRSEKHKTYKELLNLPELSDRLKDQIIKVDQTPPEDPNFPKYLWKVGMGFQDRYKRRNLLEDLEAALQMQNKAIDLTSKEHPSRAGRLESLAISFKDRYWRLKDRKDLEAALEKDQEAVDLTPEGHPKMAERLNTLATTFKDLYLDKGDAKDLDIALQKYQEALDIATEDDYYIAECLYGLGVGLGEQYRRTGELRDLKAALQTKEEAVYNSAGSSRMLQHQQSLWESLTDWQKYQEAEGPLPADDPDKQMVLEALAVALSTRYQRLGDLKDLEAALETDEEILELCRDNPTDRARCLKDLAVSLRARYQRLEDPADLETALQNYQEAIKLIPEDDPDEDKPQFLQGLSACLIDRYQRFGNLENLDDALQTAKQAADLCSEDHPDRGRILHSLSLISTYRYQRVGELGDLEDALEMAKKSIIYFGYEDQAIPYKTLATCFALRYHRLGELADLEDALVRYRLALEVIPEGHPDRPEVLAGLSISLADRYKRLGDLDDLEASLQWDQQAPQDDQYEEPRQRVRALLNENDPEPSLQWDQQALHLVQDGRYGRARLLLYFSGSLVDRYKKFGDVRDLDRAVQMNQEAVRLIPDDHPDKAEHMYTLASYLSDRYQRLGDQKDLKTVLQNLQEAVEITLQGHTNRAKYLQSLALALKVQYQCSDDFKDLEAGLKNIRDAVDNTPAGHGDEADYLHTLAILCMDRYQKLGQSEDLEEALQKLQKTLKLTPKESPKTVGFLQDLAVCHIHRYERSQKPEDLKAVRTYYYKSFKNKSFQNGTTLFPEESWNHAINWANFSEKFHPLDCCIAYLAAFHVLPDIIWIGHSFDVRQAAIRRLNVGAVISSAIRSCISLSLLTSGIEILEQGVAVIFQQMLQLQSNVDGLSTREAIHFQRLSSELYTGQATHLMNVVNRRNHRLAAIREQFEDFMRPKQYTILRNASKGGPIVILNSHRNGCDGILMINPTSEPLHIPLPNVTLAALEKHTSDLKELLGRSHVRSREESVSTRLFGRQETFTSKTVEESFEDMLIWLWMHVVAPVYQALESHGIDGGRLWWLPTGAFTGLPLHACPPNDRFVHSYTATLGALLDADARPSLDIAPKVGVVGVTHTGAWGLNHLKGVALEVDRIRSIIENAQVLQGQQATVDAVKEQLQDCSWLHLACHGKQDLYEPTKSRLLLYGGILELEAILRMPLSNAQFVFLAACQTAMGDSGLINESFHLGGGLIAAGFRGAVGTLWSMDDRDGPLVADTFYSHLFSNGQSPKASKAAEALHLAVKELKKRGVPYQRWIPFIHMGV